VAVADKNDPALGRNQYGGMRSESIVTLPFLAIVQKCNLTVALWTRTGRAWCCRPRPLELVAAGVVLCCISVGAGARSAELLKPSR